MFKDLFSLALQGIRRKKRSSRLVFSVLLVSFAFAILSLSLVTSISRTNEEIRYDTYGEWYLAIPSAYPEDEAWLQDSPWTEDIGIAKDYGDVLLHSSQVGFGTVNDELIDMGHLRLDSGHWPKKDDEIALEARTLELLDYDQTLGQEICLDISTKVEGTPVKGTFTFKLCGVIHEYTRLWFLEENAGNRRFIGAVVTPDGAEQVHEAMREELRETPEEASHADLIASNMQLYVTVDEQDRDAAVQEVSDHMKATRKYPAGIEDHIPSVNYRSYFDTSTEQTYFYTLMIGAVAMIAVLCAYIMQLPAEIQSFATLRSIGITKPQLAGLLLTETALLMVPAVVLGIPLGIGLTWLALKLFMYAGAAPVRIQIPVGPLFITILLWLLMVLLSRSIVFLLTIRTPLVGRFQLGAAKSRRSRRFRTALISLLLLCFGGVVVYTATESKPQFERRYRAMNYPSYTICCGVYPIYDEERGLFRDVPGFIGVDGISRNTTMMAYLSFEGFDERVQITPVEDSAWEDILSLGEDREAFHNGEFCLLYFPDDGDDYILPQGDVFIHLSGHGEIDEAVYPPTPVKILRLSRDIFTRSVVFDPYAIICSHAYMERLISSMKPGTQWNEFVSGEEYGYQHLLLSVDILTNDLSTEKTISDICRENGLSYDSNCEYLLALFHEANQQLILIFAGGGSIAVVLLLILTSAISLESEQEKRRYKTLRTLGMSRWQMRRDILGRGIRRTLLALVGGWLLCLLVDLVRYSPETGVWARCSEYISRWSIAYPLYSAAALLCVLTAALLVCLLSKRRLIKEADTL